MAVSDETSVAGRPGLVDQAQFARAAVAIDQACQALADPTSDQQQVGVQTSCDVLCATLLAPDIIHILY